LGGDDWIPDDERKITDNAFTPRAGLTWLFGDKVSIYALYDQCFIPQAGRSFEHKRFKPLTGYNIETGMKGYFFNNKLSLNLSIFKIVKNNMLTSDPLHQDFQIQRGQITSKGIDFDMTGNITPSLIVNANYEYINAKVTKDNDPKIVGTKNFGTPDHQANLWLQYKWLHGALRGFSFFMGDQYLSKRSAVFYLWVPDKTKYLPGYNVLDAGIGFSNDRFNAGLHFNITNIQYASNGYFNFSSNEWRYTPGEPLNFRLSFGVNLVHNKEHK
jgi:iron complex outermembrane receptor protein